MAGNDDADDDGYGQTVAVPTIDVISNDTFAYSRQEFPSGHSAGRGILNLNFQYVLFPLLASGNLYPSRPFETPIMGGGLFAINADFFWEIGTYDAGLDTYGKSFVNSYIFSMHEFPFNQWMSFGAYSYIFFIFHFAFFIPYMLNETFCIDLFCWKIERHHTIKFDRW